MSSPFQRTPSSSRSTPSRYANGVRKNGHHRSPSRLSLSIDSPSRQILEEYARIFVHDDLVFHRSLDEQTAAQQQRHLDALDRALAKHAEVRQSAERARERADLEIERERRRRIDEEARAVERAESELALQKLAEETRRQEAAARQAELHRRRQEQLRTEEEMRRKAETEARQEQERFQQKAAEQKAEAERAAKQEADARRLAEQRAAQQANRPPAQPISSATQANGVGVPPNTTVQLPPGVPKELVTAPQSLEETHNKYLVLHKRLKGMREEVTNQYKQIGPLKTQVSDWRRAIKKCVGQMGKAQTSATRDGNRKSIQEVTHILDQACQIATPSINITDYLVDNQQPAGATTHGPAILLLLLNYFAKYIISQMTHESGVDAKTADPLGVMAVTIFARPNYLFNGQSLIDIFWAKYHKACPALFGINGSETTAAGRVRLGWAFDKDDNAFIEAKEHFDRMAGLGAGYAAITLRDFSKSKNANPAPNRLYWQAMARLLNTPAGQVSSTHFVLLKAMIQNFIPRILATFGSAGVALIRTACRGFPELKGPRNEKGNKLPAVTALESLPGALQHDIAFSL